MARKLLQTITTGMNTAKVYRDSEWNEFVVQFYQCGVKLVDASYHTDSKDDAIGTANIWSRGE